MGIKLIVTDLDGTFLDTYHNPERRKCKSGTQSQGARDLCGRRYGAQLERL